MSERWWDVVDSPAQSSPDRWVRPAEERAPVRATRLKLPPPVLLERPALRVFPESAKARSLYLEHTAIHVDSPCVRKGFVLFWRGRDIDLRSLFFRRYEPPPDDSRISENSDPDDLTGQRSSRDMLPFRLFALLQPPPESLLRTNGPLEWPAQFYPFQIEGIRVLSNSSHLLLADEMGLGKTVQAIAALRLLFHQRSIQRALIVAPASLIEQWRQEIERWAPDLLSITVQGSAEQRTWQWQYRSHLTLVSYDTLRVDCTGKRGHTGRWSVVVLDEAQRIKNRITEVSRTCKRLPRQRSWALTGTPLENSVDDLASILEFVAGGDDEDTAAVTGLSPRAMLSRYQLRRRKSEVLEDLPERVTSDLLLPLTPSQRRAYDDLEHRGMQELDTRNPLSIPAVLTHIHRLKQVCNFASDGSSAKMDDLETRLEELAAAGHRALVFTQYTGESSGAKRIASRLRRFSPLLYTGEQSLAQRSHIIEEFRENETHKALILSLGAGGQGLNLQSASYVFHFDRGWNPATEAQAEGRAHRVGQTSTVNVYRYIMVDTIEQRIHTILRNKVGLFQETIEDVSLDVQRFLNRDEILGLIGFAGSRGAD